MLQTYHAEITGTQLQWLDTPPASVDHQRVLIVFDSEASSKQNSMSAPSDTPLNNAFKAARGSLPGLTRESVLADIAASRNEWS